MSIGIYRIVSPTNSIYVGQSWNLENRKKYYERLHCKSQYAIYNSLKKYGFEQHTFEILVLLIDNEVTQEKLDELEKYYIKYYKESGCEMLNIAEGGRYNGKLWLGRKHSEETKIKMSLIAKGRKKSIEHINKVREANQQRFNSIEYQTKRIEKQRIKKEQLVIKREQKKLKTIKKRERMLEFKKFIREFRIQHNLIEKKVHPKPSAKLKSTDIPPIRELIGDGFSNKIIADMFNVDRRTIADIRRNITWRDC